MTRNELNTFNGVYPPWIRRLAMRKLIPHIDEVLKDIGVIDEPTWKITAYNIIKSVKNTNVLEDLVESILEVSDLPDVPDSDRSGHITSASRSSQHRVSDSHNDSYDTFVLYPKVMRSIVKDIAPSKPLSVRLQTLTFFLHAQLPKNTSSEAWQDLLNRLLGCLCDSNFQIFMLSLKIHIKLINSSLSELIKDTFKNLTTGLIMFYSKRFQKYLPDNSKGIDLGKPLHSRLLRLTNVVVDIAKEHSKNWFRYNDKDCLSVIDSFVDVLLMNTRSKSASQFLYPLDFVSILDPKATWYSYWFHSTFNKNLCFSMKKMASLISLSIENVVIFKEMEEYRIIEDNHKNISTFKVNQAVFSHSVGIICITATAVNTKTITLQPIEKKVITEPIPIADLLKLILTILNESFVDKFYYYITNFILDLLSSRNFAILQDSSIVAVILQPLLYKEVLDGYCPQHTFGILDKIVDSSYGISYLLEPNHLLQKSIAELQTTSSTDSECHPPVTVILNSLMVLMRNGHNIAAQTKLLHVSGKILQAPVTFRMAGDTCNKLITLIMTLSFETSKDQQLNRAILDFLALSCGTPLGLHAASKQEKEFYEFQLSMANINNSVLFANMTAILSSMSLESSYLSSELHKLVTLLLSHLWDELEDQTSFLTGSTDKGDKATKHFLSFIYNVSLSVKACRLLLMYDDEASEETLIDTDFGPSTLEDLFDLNGDIPDDWHHIGLKILEGMMKNLNTHLFLRNELNLKEQLLTLQEKYRIITETNEEITIINECSLLRSKLISWCNGIQEITEPEIAVPGDDATELHLLNETLEQIIQISMETAFEINWISRSRILHVEEILGIELVIRYGTENKLLEDSSSHVENLNKIFTLSYTKGSIKFEKFDWFVATAYLICKGDEKRCVSFLKQTAGLPVSLVIWPALYVDKEAFVNFKATFNHMLEIIVSQELPMTWNILKHYKIPWGAVCCIWMEQTFWNVLHFSYISSWLSLCFLHPLDMSVYFVASILRQLEPTLLESSSSSSVWDVFHGTPFANFQLQISYMEMLSSKYRKMILPPIQNVSDLMISNQNQQ